MFSLVLWALLAVPHDPRILTIPVVHADPLSKEELMVIASTTAQAHHLNPTHFVKTIECESSFNPEAVGDATTSFGIAQIHLPAHPEITKEQALEPRFAIEWMAQEWQADRAHEWSCFSILKNRGWVEP